MHKVPQRILVTSIIKYTNNHELVDIIKDYFKEIPHIDCTCEDNKQSIVYIVQDNYCVKSFLHKLYSMKDRDRILRYSFYYEDTPKRAKNQNLTYYLRIHFTNMPDRIVLNNIDVSKLRLLSKE